MGKASVCKYMSANTTVYGCLDYFIRAYIRLFIGNLIFKFCTKQSVVQR